jgi:hypothetical protein
LLLRAVTGRASKAAAALAATLGAHSALKPLGLKLHVGSRYGTLSNHRR